MKFEYFIWAFHCVKSVRIRSFSGPHFPAYERVLRSVHFIRPPAPPHI